MAVSDISGIVVDPHCAALLRVLTDGRALTARELARASGLTAVRAADGLDRLKASGMLAGERQGCHRYFRLASPAVIATVERAMQSLPAPAPAHQTAPKPVVSGPRDPLMRRARTCYGHFAGRLGVGIFDAMAAAAYISIVDDAVTLSHRGEAFLGDLGIDPASLRPAGVARSVPVRCRTCLDWSERRPHLGGRLGAALCQRALELGWVQRQVGTRAVRITAEGTRQWHQWLGMQLDERAVRNARDPRSGSLRR